MKKLLLSFLCLCGLFIFGACSNKAHEELRDDTIYFFYQTTCPHCHDAAKYIKANYPTLQIKSLDIKLPGNLNLFKYALKKYNIVGNAGTPLLCFGPNFIMGWGEDQQVLFNSYVKPYLK